MSEPKFICHCAAGDISFSAAQWQEAAQKVSIQYCIYWISRQAANSWQTSIIPIETVTGLIAQLLQKTGWKRCTFSRYPPRLPARFQKMSSLKSQATHWLQASHEPAYMFLSSSKRSTILALYLQLPQFANKGAQALTGSKLENKIKLNCLQDRSRHTHRNDRKHLWVRTLPLCLFSSETQEKWRMPDLLIQILLRRTGFWFQIFNTKLYRIQGQSTCSTDQESTIAKLSWSVCGLPSELTKKLPALKQNTHAGP